jgi:multidrug efflux pump subunit AcrB
MWMTLLALRNSIAILMASLAVVVLGGVALGRLPVDLFPNINLPIINVGTMYTGAGVLDVEKTVTYPIEKAVSAISDVRFVESRSRQGLSTVRVWMNWGADVNDGQTEARTGAVVTAARAPTPHARAVPFTSRRGRREEPAIQEGAARVLARS